MSLDFKHQIEKLQGVKNWSKWKRQVELLLIHHDVQEWVVGTKVIPVLKEGKAEDADFIEKLKKFKKLDALAQLILVCSLDEDNVVLKKGGNSACSFFV